MLTCEPTGDTYIGSSKDVLLRYRLHISEMDTGRKIGLFKKLVEEHGSGSFKYSLLAPEYDDVKRNIKEAEFIEKLKPTLNVSKGFGNTKYAPSVYKQILEFKFNNMSSKLAEVAENFPEVEPRIVSDVINLRKYNWLKHEMPEQYEAVQEYLLFK